MVELMGVCLIRGVRFKRIHNERVDLRLLRGQHPHLLRHRLLQVDSVRGVC